MQHFTKKRLIDYNSKCLDKVTWITSLYSFFSGSSCVSTLGFLIKRSHVSKESTLLTDSVGHAAWSRWWNLYLQTLFWAGADDLRTAKPGCAKETKWNRLKLFTNSIPRKYLTDRSQRNYIRGCWAVRAGGRRTRPAWIYSCFFGILCMIVNVQNKIFNNLTTWICFKTTGAKVSLVIILYICFHFQSVQCEAV